MTDRSIRDPRVCVLGVAGPEAQRRKLALI
jgi:hypothetical protein